jgi:endo-1,4-beta-xylanase
MAANVLSAALPFQWRTAEGEITVLPDPTIATDKSLAVHRSTDGHPVMVVEQAVSRGDVLMLQGNFSIIETETDAGADGQAGIILTATSRAVRQLHNPQVEHRQIIIIGSQKEMIRVAFRASRDFEAGELILVPNLAYFGRPILIADLEFSNFGGEADPDELTAAGISYAGQEADAPWREVAREKINQHRKADIKVTVVDRWGIPIPGARVTVEQQEHAYLFGTAVIGSRIVDAPREWTPESGMTTEQWLSDNARYREELKRNFNTVVFENELKWPQWAGVRRDIHRQEWTADALRWFREYNFTVKGHTMVWGSWRFSPEWLREKEDEPEALQRAAISHIRDIGHATADWTQYWDVLNEPMSHRNLIEILGHEKVADWFREARKALPGNRLVMNEFDLVGNGGNPRRRASFLEFYHDLVKHGAEIDVIGFQGHFWSERFTAPEVVWEIIDEVHGSTGLPIMISEFDTNFPNDRLQADYTRDFLTAWFAHPATEAFIKWGFWGGGHWMGDAGSMFRRDWSEKPNLAEWRNLIFNEWWTQESVESDEEGLAIVRAFKGRHHLSVTHPTTGVTIYRDITLAEKGRAITVILHEF